MGNNDAQFRNEDGKHQRPCGLAVGGGLAKRGKERENVILRNGLQKARGPHERLQPSANGGKEGAEQDDHGMWPGHFGNDQSALETLAKFVSQDSTLHHRAKEAHHGDVDDGCGGHGQQRANRDGAACVQQIPRAVRASHDPWRPPAIPARLAEKVLATAAHGSTKRWWWRRRLTGGSWKEDGQHHGEGGCDV